MSILAIPDDALTHHNKKPTSKETKHPYSYTVQKPSIHASPICLSLSSYCLSESLVSYTVPRYTTIIWEPSSRSILNRARISIPAAASPCRLYIQPTMQPVDPYTEKPSCCVTIVFLGCIYKSTHTRSKDTYRRIIARVAGGLTMFHALPSKHSTQSSSAKESQRFTLTTALCVECSECHTLSNNQRWKGL